MSTFLRLLLGVGIALASGAVTAAAEPFGGDTPAALEGIEITDRSGEQVPPDILLVDEAGNTVRLGDYFRGRPLVVQLMYFNCPMLCTLVLNGYVDAARELDWVPGQEYEVLSVSFDPRDTAELAAAKKKTYVEELGKPGAGEGWHFLTGSEAEVARLAEALGFGYRWDDTQKQYAHAAGMFVLTPRGMVSRTLYGIEYPGREFRLSLTEASEGRLGSPLDKLVLYCFQYNSEKHKYALVATNVMKLGAFATVLLLGGFIALQWMRERTRPPQPAV
jgi:protein SCO1/2